MAWVTAVVQIQSLAQELPHAKGVALEKAKRQQKKKAPGGFLLPLDYKTQLPVPQVTELYMIWLFHLYPASSPICSLPP